MIPITNNKDTSGFYRVKNGRLEHAFDIITANYELYRTKAHEYVYPVDGWSFFYSRLAAESYFKRRGEI
mgnify:CR=1 FL=1